MLCLLLCTNKEMRQSYTVSFLLMGEVYRVAKAGISCLRSISKIGDAAKYLESENRHTDASGGVVPDNLNTSSPHHLSWPR